jgi:hypothetical protein
VEGSELYSSCLALFFARFDSPRTFVWRLNGSGTVNLAWPSPGYAFSLSYWVGNRSDWTGWAISHWGAFTANLWLSPNTSASLSFYSFSFCFCNSRSSRCLSRPLISTEFSITFSGLNWFTTGLKVQSFSSSYSLARLAYAIAACFAFNFCFNFSEKVWPSWGAYSDVTSLYFSLCATYGLNVHSCSIRSFSSAINFSFFAAPP